MKYLIKYYLCQSDSMFAIPTFTHEEVIECSVPRKIKEYVEKQKDGYGHGYKQNRSFGFDYISKQGAVKVSEYKPKIKQI